MPLTPVEQVKLEIGLNGLPVPILTDDEIQYFLDKNNGSVRRAALDAAKTVLFILSRYVRERTGEIEVYGEQYFRSYMDALNLYIKDPNYSIAIASAKPYAGGISRADAIANATNPDTIPVVVEKALPQDYDGAADLEEDNPFDRDAHGSGFFGV